MAANTSKPWADAIRRALARWNDPEQPGRRALDMLADKLVARACQGDAPSMQEIANRTDGKPHQSMSGAFDHTHSDGYEHLSDGELMARIAELQAQLARTSSRSN